MDIEPNTTLHVRESTHAPLLKRFMDRERGFEPVGDDARSCRVDPETGAEYRALGGPNHRYNRDYKIGPSYPDTVFFTAVGPDGSSLTHDELADLLDVVGFGDRSTTEVLIPKGYEPEPTWYQGFMVRPPEMAPRLEHAERLLSGTTSDVHNTGHVVEAHFWNGG